MTDTTREVLSYWQQGLWRNQYNDLPLKAVLPTSAVSRSEIASGMLSSSLSSKNIWIAPFVFENIQNNMQSWIPIWLPAKIEAGCLDLTDALTLPWIPASQFDVLQVWSPFSEPLHVMDDIFSHEFMTETHTLAYNNWQDFYQASLSLLNQLSESQWQTRLEAAGFILAAKAFILDNSPSVINPNTLLTQYATLEEYEPRPVAEEMGALETVLALEAGEFVAIKAPIGADKIHLIQSVIEQNKASSRFYLLTPHAACINMTIPMQAVQIDPEILSLQIQDEEAEKELNALLQAQQECREKIKNRSIWVKLSEILGNKKSRSEREAYEKLSEQIRQCKVKRTKLHQQLVIMVDIVAARKPLAAPIMPQNWELYTFTIVNQIGRWEKTDTLSEGVFLWIDEANQLLPQQVVPFLARAQRAVFLGDNQDITPSPTMSALSETCDLTAHRFVDEETIEQLHYKGMLQSAGNAFTVALANNAYQSMTEYGMWASTLALPVVPQTLSYLLVPVCGKSELQTQGLCNPIEAKAISDGLLKNKSTSTAIITPFYAQKVLLETYLAAAQIECVVFTLDALPHQTWDHIIFSPVYTHADRRPFIFDQGDHYFYSMRARAHKTFTIIGDSAIFDPKMHSPSGNIAKMIASKELEFTL